MPPKILLLDAAGRPCRIGLGDESGLIAVETLDDARRHARDLAAAVERLLDACAHTVDEIGLIGVATGPGSFTGIRVAVAFAKSISYVTGCAVVGVDAFDLAMAPFYSEHGPVRVVVDFHLGTKLSGVYEKSESKWQRGAIQNWNGQVGDEAAWTGPGLSKLEKPATVTVLGTAPWASRLEDLHAIALDRWRNGRPDDVWKLEPFYVRPSSAEEMWDARTA